MVKNEYCLFFIKKKPLKHAIRLYTGEFVFQIFHLQKHLFYLIDNELKH